LDNKAGVLIRAALLRRKPQFNKLPFNKSHSAIARSPDETSGIGLSLRLY
jgi:hypothetical protein